MLTIIVRRQSRTNDGDGDGIGDLCDPCPTLSDADADHDDIDGDDGTCDNCPAPQYDQLMLTMMVMRPL